MADITVSASKVRPLNGAIIRRMDAGGTLSVGDAVYVDSNGKVQRADASTLANAQARGLVIAVGTAGATGAVSGDVVDVVTHGPVEVGASSLTNGAAVYVSTTAGAM